jgi:E3 ubiquitin-protein ligase HACE1
MAANVGAFECLSLFLKKGIHINVTDDSGVTPLHLAARNGHKKCVHRLIECGADIHIQDKDGLTAVHWLACSGRTELLSDLLDKGEFVDVVVRTATDNESSAYRNVCCCFSSS